MGLISILTTITMTVMATLATMAIESSKESPGVPTLATPEDYRLSARQASPTISTAAAATVDGLVNLDSMPSCAFKSCVVSSHPALPCPTVSTSCSASASATAASDGCAGVGIPTTCYCALPNPLFCAWGCRWFDWMLAENWFNATCPQVPPIDFTPVPACARACFEESIFNYGCLTYQKNCFCSVGSLFGCNAGCTPQENQTIASWYASACVVPTASALQVAAVQTTGSSIIPSSHPWGGFSWYEIFSIVVGGLSVVAFLIYVSVWKDIINRRDLSRLEKARTQQRKKIKG